MNLNDACVFLARRIYKTGEYDINDRLGTLIPSAYADTHTEYNTVSDAIGAGLNTDDQVATHYDLKWSTPGKVITIRFYAGEAYGATIITPDMRMNTVALYDTQSDELQLISE